MTGIRLRVATYNIHGCVGTDGRYAPDRIAAVIRELDADVLALQELDNRRPPHDGFHQLDYLRDGTGMEGIPGATIVEEAGTYGNALFTRMPVLASRDIDLSVSAREPRRALDVTIDAPPGPLRVIATHLGLGVRERHRQMWQLIGEVGARTPGAVATVLVGDLNEWLPTARCLRALGKRFDRTFAARTWPARMPLLALDRIYARPAPTASGMRVHASPLARRASDHLPLVVDLSW